MSIIPQLILNSIIAGSIYMLVALGFNLAYSTTKFFNMAHGAMIVIGGYTVFWLTGQFGLNLYLSIVFGVAAAAVSGFILEKIVYLPLRKKKVTNMALLIASLGAFFLLQAVVAMIFSSRFQSLSSQIPNQKIFQVAGGSITEIQLIIFISGIVIMALLAIVLKKTMLGKQIRAIADDEEVAKIIGINTNKVIGYVFTISSAIAGFAGILVGLDTGIEPGMGLDLFLAGVISAIVGGVGNVYGSVLGAFLLAFSINFGIWLFPGEWQRAIAYGILIIFLIFRPQGILGKKK